MIVQLEYFNAHTAPTTLKRRSQKTTSAFLKLRSRWTSPTQLPQNKKMEIIKVIGREILDSRGNPTVEADALLADGTLGRAAVPSGASTGEHEAVELRDNDPKRYLGKGTRKAARNIKKKNAPAITGMGADDQSGIA